MPQPGFPGENIAAQRGIEKPHRTGRQGAEPEHTVGQDAAHRFSQPEFDGRQCQCGQQKRPLPYRIPSINPFQAAGQVAGIYAFDFRNPDRFAVDRVDLGGNGQIIVADVGQRNIEEIDRLELGGNFGWAIEEGTFPPTATAASSPCWPRCPSRALGPVWAVACWPCCQCCGAVRQARVAGARASRRLLFRRPQPRAAKQRRPAADRSAAAPSAACRRG